MLRGKQKMKDLCTDMVPKRPSAEPRSASLYNDKVQLMVARYYYLRTVDKHSSNEDILLRMRSEFFISTGHMVNILNEHLDEIQQMRKTLPQKEWFVERWGHIAW